MKRPIIPASPEHEKEFRATWKLRADVADDSIWQAAYDHAATQKLYSEEVSALGEVLERK